MNSSSLATLAARAIETVFQRLHVHLERSRNAGKRPDLCRVQVFIGRVLDYLTVPQGPRLVRRVGFEPTRPNGTMAFEAIMSTGSITAAHTEL